MIVETQIEDAGSVKTPISGAVNSAQSKQGLSGTDALVKAHEAGPAVGLSASFLYAGAKAGIVPCFRARRSVRFCIAELRQWMREQAEKCGRTIGGA